MQMDVKLTQAEFKAAIRNFISEKFSVARGQELSVSEIKIGRGENADVTATVDITSTFRHNVVRTHAGDTDAAVPTPAGSSADQAGTDEPANTGAGTDTPDETPTPAGAEEAPSSAGEQPPVDNDHVADGAVPFTEETIAANADAPKNEDTPAAPEASDTAPEATSPVGSLFANLKRPNNG